MKNLIYILFATMILASCSSENDNISPSTNEAKLYTVNLSVKIPSLTIDQSQLKSTIDDGDLKIVQVSIYKSTGEIYTNLQFNIDDIKQQDGSLLVSFRLPANNYKCAILGSSKDNYLAYFNPQNYNNDYYHPFAYDNKGLFYNTSDFSIQPIDEPQNMTSIELQPMWSNINMIIEDAQAFDVPEGTNALEFVVSPYYNGFGIDNKLATNVYEIIHNIVDLNTIRANSSYRNTVVLSKTIAEKNKLEVSINYLKKESGSEYTTLETRELKIPDITIENGYYYNIKGRLNAKDNNQSMNISLGEFNKEAIVIEF